MLTVLLLLTYANGFSYVESQYATDELCQGPPTAIIVFTALDLENGSHTETWPIFSTNYGIDEYCGNAALLVKKACCISIIPNSESDSLYQGSRSGIREPVASMTEYLQGVPPFTTANYCKVFTKGNYEFMYIQNDGSSCIDGHFSCSQAGVLSIYNSTDIGCLQEPIQKYSLTETRFNYSEESYIGEFTAEFGAIDGSSGAGAAEWVTFEPATDLIPNHKYFIEIFATMLFVIAMLLGTVSLVFWTVQYFKRKTVQMLLMLLSQGCIVLFLMARTYYAYAILPGDSLFIFKTIKDYSFGISTLVCCISTAHFLSIILNLTTLKKKILYSGVLCLHFLFIGGRYLRVTLYKNENNPYYDSIEAYAGYDAYWSIFYFIWNVVPMFYVVWNLTSINSNGFKNHIQIIKEYDPLFFFLIGVQFFTAILFYIFRTLQIYTNTLWSDRTYLAIDGVNVFLISLSAAVNCVLIDRIKVVAKSSKIRDAATGNGVSSLFNLKKSYSKTSTIRSESAVN